MQLCSLTFYHWLPQRSAWLSARGVVESSEIASWPHLLQNGQSKYSQPLPTWHAVQTFYEFVALLLTHSNILTSFLYYVQICTQYSNFGHNNAKYNRRSISSDHLDTRFAYLDAQAHSWLILGLQSVPQGLSARLLSNHSSPSLHLCLALSCPRCSIHKLPLLNFISLLIFQCSTVCRPF